MLLQERAILTYAMKALESEDSMKRRFTFAGGEFFEYMVNNNLYSTDVKNIRKKVKEAGLLNIYNS